MRGNDKQEGGNDTKVAAEATAPTAAANQPQDGAAPAKPPDVKPKVHPAWADWLMGMIHFEDGDVQAALDCLLRAEQADPRLPNLYLRIGNTYLRMKKMDDADRAFVKALEIDGDSPEAHLGLAMVRLRQRRNEEAGEEALLAVGLQHFLPMGHFELGIALARLGHYHRAALALETAASMLPGLLAAHRWLAIIYARPGGDLAKAQEHRRIWQELRERRRTAAGQSPVVN